MKRKPTYTTYHEVIRGDDAIEVTVTYHVDDYAREASGHYGPPENYDPGNGWLFDIDRDTVEGVALTDDEVDAVHSWLEENPPVGDEDYYG